MLHLLRRFRHLLLPFSSSYDRFVSHRRMFWNILQLAIHSIHNELEERISNISICRLQQLSSFQNTFPKIYLIYILPSSIMHVLIASWCSTHLSTGNTISTLRSIILRLSSFSLQRPIQSSGTPFASQQLSLK